MKHTQSIGHLMAIFCVFVWGTTFVVSKSLLEHLTPVQLMLLRFVLGYGAMWLIHPKWYFRWNEEWRFVAMALLSNTLYAWAENTALTLTLASNVSILVSTTPIMTAFLALFFRKEERLNRRQALGFAIAFLGMVLVVFNGTVALKLRPTGDLLALLAAAAWAVYGLLLHRWSDAYNSALITRKLMFYGILSVIPLVLLGGEPIDFAYVFQWDSLLKIAFLGLVGSALCYLFWNSAVKYIGVLSTNLYIYAIPLVTLVFSAAFLGEKITLMGMSGIVLVIGGMLLSTLLPKTAEVVGDPGADPAE